MAVSQQQQQQQAVSKPAGGKHGNVLPLWGNEKTMNLNPMILTNVLSSPYFKVQLYELKTYHEVVDEIYFMWEGCCILLNQSMYVNTTALSCRGAPVLAVIQRATQIYQ